MTEEVELARLALMAATYLVQLGAAIEARRKELRLSRAAVAARIEDWLVEEGKRQPGHHFDAQNVYRWERAKSSAGTDNLEALANALETTVGELMRGIEAEPRWRAADGDGAALERLERIEGKLDDVLELLATDRDAAAERGTGSSVEGSPGTSGPELPPRAGAPGR